MLLSDVGVHTAARSDHIAQHFGIAQLAVVTRVRIPPVRSLFIVLLAPLMEESELAISGAADEGRAQHHLPHKHKRVRCSHRCHDLRGGGGEHIVQHSARLQRGELLQKVRPGMTCALQHCVGRMLRFGCRLQHEAPGEAGGFMGVTLAIRCCTVREAQAGGISRKPLEGVYGLANGAGSAFLDGRAHAFRKKVGARLATLFAREEQIG
mmetsp:Transcript_70819/g.140349  ORF Transcript_70819/g.140349 Transcript_70819/m.140349 type:complete len:209 (-) Transcript_70819:632-1258(-)